MNINIRKFFDVMHYGSSESPKPIFTPMVGVALDCVLRELLTIAKGDKKADAPSDSTVKNFEIYFSEAMESMNKGVAYDLPLLRLASLQKEYGIRIAFFLIKKFMVNGYMDTGAFRTFITVPFSVWFKRPVEDLYMAEMFTFMLEFNLQLTDSVARSIVQRS